MELVSYEIESFFAWYMSQCNNTTKYHMDHVFNDSDGVCSITHWKTIKLYRIIWHLSMVFYGVLKEWICSESISTNEYNSKCRIFVPRKGPLMRMFNIDLETTLLTYVDVNIYHYDETLNLVKLLFSKSNSPSSFKLVHERFNLHWNGGIWQNVAKYGKLRRDIRAKITRRKLSRLF